MTFATTKAARITSAAVVVFVLGSSSSTARAQGRDTAAAEAAFAEARALMQKGRFEEACPKLEASQSLDPALGTLLNLADCYEKIGKTASAWVRYREAASVALERASKEREAIARERAAALEPRLCRLVVKVGEPPPDLVVTRDGSAVSRAAFGIPVPVDPGTHHVEARATGMAPFSTDVDVRPPAGGGPCELVTVTVSGSGEGGVAAAKPVFKPIDLTPDAVTPAEPSRSSSWGTMHTVAVVSAGLGVVGLGIGTAFGLSASGTKSDAEAYCVSAGCTADGKALLADAGSAADASTVAFSVGAFLLVTGVVLWIASPSLH